MCGISGIISPHRLQEEAAEKVKRMTVALAHRGPDGEGYWNNPEQTVFMGHRRLAIIDLTEGGAQPMQYRDRYHLVYNGEIYNYLELRRELETRGYVFTTQSDTEVLLLAYACWGEKCLEKLDGMFAFAVWDEQEKSLFLARDRFGQKPLYYHRADDQCMYFASELKAFWAAGIARKWENSAVLYFLGTGQARSPLSPENCFFESVYQVPAAHYMLYRQATDELVLERYCDLDKTALFAGSPDDAVAAMGKALRQSVAVSLRADQRVGSSLSGGIDSGSIAFEVSRLLQTQYHSFSAFFPGFEKDESDRIEALARFLGIHNHPVMPDEDGLQHHIDELLYQQDEPIGSASVYAQYRVFQLAKEKGITVLLDGQGADELLGGYDTGIGWFLQSLWRRGQFRLFRDERKAFAVNGWTDFGWRNRVAALFPAAAQIALQRREWRNIRQAAFVLPDRLEAFPDAVLEKPLVLTLNDLLYDELTRSRLPELLRYADRNSMAFGRELRLPFLNTAIAELAFSLPDTMKLWQGYRKWPLRKAMENKLPANIIWQGRKIGFEPPQAAWMRSPILQDRVHEARKKLVADGWLTAKVLDTPLKAAGAYDRGNDDWRHLVLACL